MSAKEKQKTISWLQLSDLHIWESTDWNIMLEGYNQLAKHIHPHFIVVTGDYLNFDPNISKDYTKAYNFLCRIGQTFNVPHANFFFVPGNHDVSNYKFRQESINTILKKIADSSDIYKNYMDGSPNLHTAFSEYSEFICKFYGNDAKDMRTQSPSGVFSVPFAGLLNVICINTALISDGSRDHHEIFDINALSSLSIDSNLPSIILAHHDIDSVHSSHRLRLASMLKSLNVKAYLCGDTHKEGIKSISKHNVLNESIPCVICGKSAVKSEDSHSDVGVIFYEWRDDGYVYVIPYEWGDKLEFKKSNNFVHDIDQDFRFPFALQKCAGLAKKVRRPTKHLKNSQKSKATTYSIWLPDAERAKGVQTRFTTFTQTPEIEAFLDPQSDCRGIISVKGIGKTFILQVKRVRLSKSHKCLPVCTTPSRENSWATERLSFNNYLSFQSSDIYNNLVLLWKFSLLCYVIRYEMSKEKKKSYNESKGRYSAKLTSDIVPIFADEILKSTSILNTIMNQILDIPEWPIIISKNITTISLICTDVLHERREESPKAKRIAIFIDKVDQAIKQTNAEPPGDCINCSKAENYTLCKNPQRSPKFCVAEDGCQSKDCCYGCEVFADSYAGANLRVYKNPPSQKIVHINIWQYLQLALVAAVDDIQNLFKGDISIYYTIRQEAYACENGRLGEQNQKITASSKTLKYSRADQHRIFLDCIQNQNPTFLFSPENQTTLGEEEYAFLGIHGLCHPYCKDSSGISLHESVFDSIFRHSFDRTRDVQRYGEILTEKLPEIRKCKDEHAREEMVKQIIETYAAFLAYPSKEAEKAANPSYYTEKMRYMPNFWTQSHNFETLLCLIDRNLLFMEDVVAICKEINCRETCPGDCKKCKHHPFSMLQALGYLGQITVNENHTGNEVQIFADATDVTYFYEADCLNIASNVAYIIHPALSKTIEKKYNKQFMHFSGFILGKDLVVSKSLLRSIFSDKYILSRDEFQKKYYSFPSSSGRRPYLPT